MSLEFVSKSVSKVASWLTPYATPLWSSKPRRVIYLFATGVLLVISVDLPYRVLIPAITEKLPKLEKVNEYAKLLEITPKDFVWVIGLVFLTVLYLALVLVAGWLVSGAVTAHIEEIIRDSLVAKDKFIGNADRLAAELKKMGFQELVPVNHGNTRGKATTLDSCTLIRDEAKLSKSIKALTIVGWEYFGGRNSVLHPMLHDNPTLSVEVVMVDPRKGERVLKERAAKLSAHKSITFEVLRAHSQEVEKEVLALNQNGETRAGVYHYPRKLPFRLLILDHCMFMSLYCPDCEGHEAAMFKIGRRLEDGNNSVWFDALNEVYENCKSESVSAMPVGITSVTAPQPAVPAPTAPASPPQNGRPKRKQ
jgi:hypothetical protein